MPNFFFLLLTLGVTLRFSYNTSHGVSAGPTSTPASLQYRNHLQKQHNPTPGSRVLIVVQNEPHDSNKPLATPLVRPFLESETGKKEKRASRKTILLPVGINRQGLLLNKPSVDETPLLKKGKSRIAKFIQPTSRQLPGIQNEIFPNPVYNDKTGVSLNEKFIKNPGIMKFRPHQPDITPNAVPVGGINHVYPASMANKINPYTNGVASSFPPGIDPFEGFIRYAAENLDTPVGNVVDYHSLEHYYGPQHPLNPSHNSNMLGKETSIENHPYADSFAYTSDANRNGGENQHPPALASPPVGTAVTIEGFRARDNSEGHGASPGIGNGDHNPLNPYEHGVDHFNAPSPGLSSAPPRPITPPQESASYEDDSGPRATPFDSEPFNNAPSQHNNSPPPPPDLRVFEEGPPPELMNPRGPPPDASPIEQGPPSNGPPPHPSIPETEHNVPVPTDGGDDAIWGILDLAEMLEKGEIPGQKKGNAPGTSASNDRVLYPLSSPPTDDLSASPPQLPFPKPPYQSSTDNSYEFDDGGANNKIPPFGSQDSQEANEYDDAYAK